jgi:hypothetical protein
MQYWVTTAIISAVQAALIIGGLAAILKWSTFVTHREFKRRTEICDRRFKELAAKDLDFNAELKKLVKRLNSFEKHVDMRFNALEARIENGGAK